MSNQQQEWPFDQSNSREGEHKPPQESQKVSRKLNNAIAVLVIAVMIAVLFVVARGAAAALPVQDLAQYWAAAHLVTSNPYSQASITGFERSLGVSADGVPMVMRNPPMALVFVLPFRFMDYPSAFAAWDLFSLLVLAGCGRAAYSLANGRPSVAPALICLLFGPTVALLMLGQIAILVLLGITLFLIMGERRSDWRAGAALSLTIVKPHIALLFLAAVALWSIHHKRWKILVGGAGSLGLMSAVVMVINPNVFAQYLAFVKQFTQETTPYPNIGGLLFTLSGVHFLAFLPQISGFAWFIFYWIRHRDRWDWQAHGMIVLMVSLVCSYYSFPFDQIILIPALMTAFANGDRRLFLYAFVATNLGFVIYISGVAGHFGGGPMFLWWTASGWFVTYLLATCRPSTTNTIAG